MDIEVKKLTHLRHFGNLLPVAIQFFNLHMSEQTKIITPVEYFHKI